MINFTTRRAGVFLLILIISGCSVYLGKRLDDLYGIATPQDRMVAVDSDDGVFYSHEVKPILEQRCVVCHGCYDAPCQLKLSSPAGIDRGATKEMVYDSARLVEADPTRLFVDARTTAQWRDKSFYPVLNERDQQANINLEAGVLYQMLDLKRQNPLPADPLLGNEFDLKLGSKPQCSPLDEWEQFANKHPLWGMPYATPGLSDQEFTTLETWLAQGAQMAGKPKLGQNYLDQVQKWEAFLNGDSLKERLMARYVYEHWFLGHLYFDNLPEGEFFRLVRSRTPSGQPIDRIASRRPYDDPGVERVYYRLWREQASIVAKTHMPYALNDARLEWLENLFLTADYEVSSLPGYQTDVAANPFIAFESIPVNSRWRFLLQESRFTVMNFIKGPVCRGQVALDVINDRFWVFFVNPKDEDNPNAEHFLASQSGHLSIPDQAGSDAAPMETWVKYSKLHEKYLEAKVTWLNKQSDASLPLDLNLVWDGDGDNQNAALTVFRHFNSASVVNGLVGEPPKTAWIIDYSLLERIHYLLVAGFDIYGNLGHQLNARLYMAFLRMEGEFNFLALMPADERVKIYKQWYRDAPKRTESYLFGEHIQLQKPSAINYVTDNPKLELFGMLKKRLAAVLFHGYDLNPDSMPDGQWSALNRLNTYTGLSASYLPQVTFLTVTSDKGPRYYTILHNNAHSNITSLFREDRTRLPAEDSITVVQGFIGAYPDAFWVTGQQQLGELADAVLSLQSKEDYTALVNEYGIRRTDERLWAVGDDLYQAYKTSKPVEAGLFDFSRLENR